MSISIPNYSHREGNTILPQGPHVIGGNGVAVTGKTNNLPLFRDYGKAVNDLITKGFPATYKFEVVTAAENGLKFTFSAERRNGDATNPDNIFLSSKVNGEFSYGVNTVGIIDSEKLEGEISFNEIGLTGAKAVFKGKFLDNDRNEASAEAQYTVDNFSSAVGIFVKDQRPRLEAQVNDRILSNAVAGDSTSVGLLASYYLPTNRDGALDSVSLGANYVARSTNFTTVFKAAVDPKASNELAYSVNSRVHYRHNTDSTFGADVTYVLRRPFKELELKLVAEHRFDANTTGRLGVERSGKVRLAVAQKVNPNFTLTLGAEVNALRLDEHRVGVHATFNA